MNLEPTRRWLLALALVWAVIPGSLGAQEPEREVGAWLGPSLLVSEVSDGVSVLAGVEAGLSIGSGIGLAGVGYTLLRDVEVDRPGTTPLDLSLGYGGVLAYRTFGDESNGWSLGVGLLAGGGTARVRDPAADVELGSDNFAVLEPRVQAGRLLLPFLRANVSVRFRTALGVEDLSGLSETDLQGFSAAIAVTVGSFADH